MISRVMPFWAAFFVLGFLILAMPQAFAYSAGDLKRADTLYMQKSYGLAAPEYARLMAQKTDNDALAREVEFKWADSIIRGRDAAAQDKAEKTLTDIATDKTDSRWKAEAGVTLAHYYVKIRNDPWSHQQQIRDWLDYSRNYWARSSDLDLARPKFIESSFMLADFVTTHWGWYYTELKAVRLGNAKIAPPDQQPQGNAGLQVVYEEILKVAKSDDDKARARYGLAMAYMNDYSADEKRREQALSEFGRVIKDFPKSEWADDAWYQMGSYHENHSDYVKAVEVYRDFLRHYRKGESQYVDNVTNQLKYITDPSLSLSVGNTFVPGSQVRFNLNWRNLSEARITLYKIDLADETRLKDSNHGYSNYQNIVENIAEEMKRGRRMDEFMSFTAKLKNEGKHQSYSEMHGLAEWMDEKGDVKAGILPAGAYLVMVTGAGGAVQGRDLILVSDMALASKISKDKALFFAMNAENGRPVANAKISFVYSWYEYNYGTRWESGTGTTDKDGLLVVPLKHDAERYGYYQQHDVFAAATAAGNKQTFVQNNYYHNSYNNKGEWWLYAFTDRPAYRPNEDVHFKAILRRPEKGEFNNPANMNVRARIYDAQGNQVHEGAYTLNAYGALDGVMRLDEKAVLGEYRIHILTADNNNNLANVPLFRLEEYKLPEYLVSVAPKKPDDGPDNGRGVATYRLGDTLQIAVDAKYYFGGAVADADVEYLVYQRPYNHSYWPTKKYAWYYEDIYNRQNDYYYGNGTLVEQKTIKTDKDGKAHFSIDTPKDSPSDLKYHVEVRVVDQSRREIRATSDIKVTRNAFFAFLEPQQHLYRPGDTAKIDIKTMTANEAPYPVEGKVTVRRNWWRDPVYKDGVAVNGGGYDGQELFTKFVTTNERGEVVFAFEPNENGYYTVEFTGFDNGNPVTAQTQLFVSDNAATNIGYRYGGLQIITEKDTYRVGEMVRAMIVSDRPDTWVLFTHEGDELYGYKMLHLEGSVRLVEFPAAQAFAPNVYFTAVSTDKYQMKQTSIQVIVPPDDKFLNVKITSDKAEYEPREDGVFDIEVTDHKGKPVSAEVALGLVDASVYYIQADYAQDIRKFFYGDKRPQNVRTQISFYQRQYVDLVTTEDGRIITRGEAEQLLRDRRANNELNKNIVGGRAYGDDADAYRQGGFKAGEVGASAPSPSVMAKEGLAMDELAEPEEKMDSSGRMEARKKTKQKDGKGQSGADNGAPDDDVTVRDDFRSTVLWQPSVVTGKNGKARVKVTFPDSLTTWRMTARADTPDTSVGNITHEVVSNKDLMVRLQAPRFFTQRDLAVVSALIDNMSAKPLVVNPRIMAEGLVVSGLYKDGKFVKGEQGPVTVPAGGQVRVDWAVSANEEGTATITVSAREQTKSGDGKSDAMKKTYPVIAHGIEKFIAKSTVMKGPGAQEAELVFDIPRERIKESTSLRINLSPSLAANMLDALPYLADYPYGCVEQTMSRFLPAMIVRKTMVDLGLKAADINAYISDVLEPRDDPEGAPHRRSDVTAYKIDDMATEGLKRLYDFQHEDGGWGWWKTDDSDRFMTAYVVWGMSMARESGVDIKPGVIDMAARYLQTQLVEEENAPDMLAWMLHALSYAGTNSKFETIQRDRLWKMRDQLNPYTRALFALSEHRRGNTERSKILAQNLINGVDEDAENGTAHWGEAGIHYRWSDGGVEATAFTIKALSTIDPQSKYLDPAVKWLTLNRRGGRWKNTRDTAIAILGLADYLKATKELSADYSYEVLVNGVSVREGRVNPANVFSFGRIVDIPADALRDGKNTVKIRMKGEGALYVSGYAKYFTLEEPITKAGNEIFVTRKYYIQSVKETLLNGLTNDWKPLNDGDTVNSGDRIRVDITLEAKNHYEYLLAEDYKPAGLEAVEITSGPGSAITLDREGAETNDRTYLYQEFRDQKAAFFITRLKQGKHLIRYELRAEVPGQFHAMPNQTHAMYVPEIRANSNEMRINVDEKVEKE